MPALFALVPGFAWRWLAIAGLVLGVTSVAWLRGVEHQEQAAALAAAALNHSRATADARQGAALRAISTRFAEDNVHAIAQAPALEAGIRRHLAADGLRCAASGGAVAPVPDVRPGPAGDAPAAGADAAGSPAADLADAGLDARIAADAARYAQCWQQLGALIDTAKAAGAATE